MVNRYGGLLPITYRMCVTGYKEKIGKCAPACVYTRVHYYKINCGVERLSGQNCKDDGIGNRIGEYGDGVNNDCRK